MNLDDIRNALTNWKDLRFEDYKFSYLILKPNAAKYYKVILNDILKNQFMIVGQYAVADYETINMALHLDQPEAMKYIIPISRVFKDLYGNYGIIIVIAKRNITYDNFCLQTVSLKKMLRNKFEFSYMAYAFDTSQINTENKHQRLVILSSDGSEVDKNKFNNDGTYMVFSINSIHSPDEKVLSTIQELQYLISMGCLDTSNAIPKSISESIAKYHTFEFIKDIY